MSFLADSRQSACGEGWAPADRSVAKASKEHAAEVFGQVEGFLAERRMSVITRTEHPSSGSEGHPPLHS